MKRNLVLFILLIFNSIVFSQLKQILILNEGAYDYVNDKILVPVYIGSFDPANGNYTKMNEISGRRF